MAFKAVHCADIHIGASFAALPSDLAAIRREEVKNSFLNLINYCKEKSVDALLICGDLFDSHNPGKSDCEFVRKAFQSLSPIPVYIIAGNHDYICAGSPFAYENYFSENVHIFPGFEYSYEIPEKNVVIHGKSYTKSTDSGFKKESFDNSKVNILCLHGDLQSSGDYCAISKEALASIPCSYAAFGHIHDGYLFEIGKVKCAYSSTLEGHGFDDCGSNGFIYIEITDKETLISQVSFLLRKYIVFNYDITGQDSETIARELKKIVNSNDLYKITLTGEFTEDINIPKIKEELKNITFYSEIYDNSLPCYDFDAIEKEESLRGEFLRKLRTLCLSEEEFILSGKAGLEALCGRIPGVEVIM